MSNFKDLTNQQFGKLTVKERVKNDKQGKARWLCECKCGNKKIVAAKLLLKGECKSCGCLKVETVLYDCIEGTNLRWLNREKSETILKNSGVVGVNWDSGKNKWRVAIGFQGKNRYLGLYDDLEKAIRVRKEAEQIYFKPILDKYSLEPAFNIIHDEFDGGAYIIINNQNQAIEIYVTLGQAKLSIQGKILELINEIGGC